MRTAKPGRNKTPQAGLLSRGVACRLVYSLLTANGAVQAELDTALGKHSLSDEDKALCTELVYGSLRWYLRLKWYAARLLRAPESLPPAMHTILVVALYELFFTRVPAYATVNTYVALVRKNFDQTLARVANGVLRASTTGEFFGEALYTAIEDKAEREACQYALPSWITALWLQEYGTEAAHALMEASMTAPPVGVRLAPVEGNAELFASLAPLAISQKELSQPCREEGRTLAFSGPLPPFALEALAAGRATRQAAASQDVLMALQPRHWPGPVWDACAGRGGKTVALLEMGIPVALASDIAAGRLRGLTSQVASFGAKAPSVARLSADSATLDDVRQLCPTLWAGLAKEQNTAPGITSGSEIVQETGVFGTVLVDAPCSGLGTLARRPEIRLRRTPADAEALSGLQGRMLQNLASFVRPGGLLVYITCTVNPSENEEQVQNFLRHTPGFILEETYHTPHASLLREFFFAACLRRSNTPA